LRENCVASTQEIAEKVCPQLFVDKVFCHCFIFKRTTASVAQLFIQLLVPIVGEQNKKSIPITLLADVVPLVLLIVWCFLWGGITLALGLSIQEASKPLSSHLRDFICR
jgi:hypothetical protein